MRMVRLRYKHWNTRADHEEGVCAVNADQVLWVSEGPDGDGATVHLPSYTVRVYDSVDEVIAALEARS